MKPLLFAIATDPTAAPCYHGSSQLFERKRDEEDAIWWTTAPTGAARIRIMKEHSPQSSSHTSCHVNNFFHLCFLSHWLFLFFLPLAARNGGWRYNRCVPTANRRLFSVKTVSYKHPYLPLFILQHVQSSDARCDQCRFYPVGYRNQLLHSSSKHSLRPQIYSHCHKYFIKPLLCDVSNLSAALSL